MTAKKIEKRLTQALWHDGEMKQALYEYELMDLVGDLEDSMRDDGEDYGGSRNLDR